MAEGSGSGRADGPGEAGGATDGAAGGAVEPTAVFELLADETRLSILRELAAERYSNWQWSGMSFAELRRAVGVEDAGNFTYHLEKLRGPLVAKDGEEYYLLNAGLEIVGAVESGRYSDTSEEVRGATSYECPYPDCERALEGIYEDQYFRLRCPDHHRFAATILPPTVAAAHSPDELVEIMTIETRQEVQRARAGVCPNCWGPIEATLPAEDPTMATQIEPDLPDGAVLATFDCRQCGLSFEMPTGACVVDHPAVVAFHHDHDEEIRRRPYVTLPFCGIGRADLESEDPVRVRVDVRLDGDALHLWLDGETNVAEYERE
ncbi:winged helix-turn-helix domain-containing protein [Halosimplex pelagicum]|uniref:Helix-turn-helix transcriptional regulator n=1 Tax=Halosimplex pelagicum TaxID=869886 RepID=A0A7D5PC19_9EURY|nr:winged helix-turn-helix domain-containing protein [Halosimplex pelagicum]QLH82742.1 helix-turn-helix transcriptional regulator [Halosimplex pelagicum]